MSEQQIKQILSHLERQDRAIADLSKIGISLREEVENINIRINPVVELLNDASGFKNIIISFMKGVLLFGSGAGVIYAFINWIRN